MAIILNKEELATNELRRDALEILEAGLEAVGTEKVLKRKVRLNGESLEIEGQSFDLQSISRMIFIGIGKCALDGAKAIEEILGDRLSFGAVIDDKPSSEAAGLKKIKYFEGTHPLPSEQNVAATREILKIVENLTEEDLVIALISGGGSALFESPIEGTSLDEIIQKTKELTARGADIYELNAARKEMSEVKGGKFAEICAPARVVSLLLSDVLGNDISVIASGPTVLEEPTERVENILLLSNRDALCAMRSKAQELGFSARIETEDLSGDAEEWGKSLALRDPEPKTCILLGGETTVKIRGDGIGGRNQTMALSALPHMKADSVLVCASSDGWDNTEHAGALADTELFQKIENLNLNPQEFLDKSDSFSFFKNAGGAIYTGKLGSNVSDLYIILYK